MYLYKIHAVWFYSFNFRRSFIHERAASLNPSISARVLVSVSTCYQFNRSFRFRKISCTRTPIAVDESRQIAFIIFARCSQCSSGRRFMLRTITYLSKTRNEVRLSRENFTSTSSCLSTVDIVGFESVAKVWTNDRDHTVLKLICFICTSKYTFNRRRSMYLEPQKCCTLLLLFIFSY